MHRFTWDMHYDPLPGSSGARGSFGAEGAVPHRTYPVVRSPWVAPGVYTVRLTANGQTLSQPIAVKMDPRVKITPEVQQIFTWTTRMENYARTAATALQEAQAMLATANEEQKKKLEELAPPEAPAPPGGGGFGGFGQPEPPAATPTLTNIGSLVVGAVMGMQASEMPPTAAQLESCKKQEAAYTAIMAKWSALKAGR
jgi:hypothetical protein